MKTFPTLILLIALPATGLYSQKPITLIDDSVSYRNHNHPGVIVTIPEVAYEKVQESWEKTMETRTKSKAVYENGEWSIFGANLKNISPTPVNIYSKLASQDSSVKLMVSVELKKDIYIEKGSAVAELVKLKSFLKQFAKDLYSEIADDQLKSEEKKLRELEKELSSYQKDESELEKSIRSNEKTTKEEQDHLAEFNNELNMMSSELLTQNAQLADLPEGPAKEERGKYIKELEKRKKKLLNDIESAEKNISNAKSDIRNANEDIPKKQDLQKGTKEKITAQESVVKKYEYKANTIKAY